ncbi:MAG: N-acetyltransferase [Anaerolineae bacterium]
MTLTVRAETLADYADIAAINARAFNRAAEAIIVALHRHRRRFDPQLSLVAEHDGRMVGHVLFSPRTIMLMGERVEAVNLAPIAIDPAYQRKGVGSALIEAGHEVARQKGYALSFLLGHVSYYPRFGYQTQAFGASTAIFQMTANVGSPLMVRPPRDEDVSALVTLWQGQEHDVDFAIEPDAELMAWISPNSEVQSRVYLKDGEIIGYVRGDLLNPRVFLARDAECAGDIAGDLALELGKTEATLTLPLHPYSSFGQGLTTHCEAWSAAMVCPLLVDTPFDEYYAQVQAGRRQPGRPIWPVAFEVE